jgi:hypothetical protein
LVEWDFDALSSDNDDDCDDKSGIKYKELISITVNKKLWL